MSHTFFNPLFALHPPSGGLGRGCYYPSPSLGRVGEGLLSFT